MSDSLIYPTLDVFLYDLAEKAGEIKVLNHTYEELDHKLDGYFYQWRFEDCYALQINCSGEKHEDSYTRPRPINDLSQIKQEISNRTPKQGEVGQSWLFSGQLTSDNYTVENIINIAEQCCKALGFSQVESSDLKRTGKLLGTTVFDLWSVSDWGDSKQNFHLVICLFDSDASIKVMADLYREFARLFLYRNKIVWAYQQTYSLRHQLKQQSLDLESTAIAPLVETIKSPFIKLDNLKQHLSSSLENLFLYETNLRLIEEQGVAIKINAENYKERLNSIRSLDTRSDLEAFQEFSRSASNKYLAQIQADRDVLTPGLLLLENSIKTIQGMATIEQTRTSQTTNLMVSAIGSGLTATGLTATAFMIDTKNISYTRTQVIGSSLLSGIISAIVFGTLIGIFIEKVWPQLRRK